MKYALLAAEGPHDQAVVGRLLELLGLKKFNGRLDALDSFWNNFIPAYPRRGNVYARMNMPSLFTSQQVSVAVYFDEGKDSLLENLMTTVASYASRAQDFHAFGLIVDADKKMPTDVVKRYAQKLRQYADEFEMSFPMLSDIPGVITDSSPRTGIFVIPDNQNSGVLDTLLVSCASVMYPDHKSAAIRFLDSLDASHTKHWKPFDREKALVASIVSVLKPGMANTPSIAQDHWISEETLSQVAELTMLYTFIQELLDLPGLEREPESVL